jgi:hypothetical protein
MKKYKKIKFKRKLNIIKQCSKEIIKFEHILKKIGYYDNSPIIKNVSRLEKHILQDYSEKYNIKIVGFIYYYPNKKSYIWRCYQESLNNSKLTKKEILNYLSMICKDIIFLEKTRIAEVGWEILYQHNLLKKSKRDLFVLYLQITRKLKIMLKEEFLEIQQKPGDVLVSRPRGLKFGPRKFNTDYEGLRQRSLSAQKLFNFGKINDWGDQYARYDDNLDLQPI